MSANPIRHSCAATARLGLAMRVTGPVRFLPKPRPAPPRPAPPHPIVNDAHAIESATVALIHAFQQNASARRTMPEDDAEAEAFFREHGLVAAICRDPVGEAFHFAAGILQQRLKAVLPAQEHEASIKRMRAALGPIRRYAADTRVRH